MFELGLLKRFFMPVLNIFSLLVFWTYEIHSIINYILNDILFELHIIHWILSNYNNLVSLSILSSVSFVGLLQLVFFKRFIHLLFIYFIYFWLRQVLVEARGIFIETCGISLRCAGSSLWCTGFSSCGTQSPGRVGSVVCGTRGVVEARQLGSCGMWA